MRWIVCVLVAGVALAGVVASMAPASGQADGEAAPIFVRRLAKIICPFLLSMCYDRLYGELNKRGHCSKVSHLEAALG